MIGEAFWENPEEENTRTRTETRRTRSGTIPTIVERIKTPFRRGIALFRRAIASCTESSFRGSDSCSIFFDPVE